jgi:glycosyltransferase involved in cell wall biosynthesis/SAM-dependent methyltransferase
LDRHIRNASPVPFRFTPPMHSPRKIDAGLYLRTDFWAQIISGGSYGHTCFVANELNGLTDRFTCLLAQPLTFLDDLGVRYAVMEAPTRMTDEDAIVTATDRYYPLVKTVCGVHRPSYIYERLCLGNYAGALLSRELQIPYIVEYNGSEISMQRGVTRSSFRYKDIYLKAEELAFRQATLISVISECVLSELLSRGVDARKIVVNPNGADPHRYAPATAERKRALRAELGFTDNDRVVGYTGTFGTWHGTNVLAEAIPRICAAEGAVRFIIIGDGPHKPQLDIEVERHRLEGRVRRVGCVSQSEGARLLQVCDIFVAPHNNANVIPGRFFGSPTKVFEYMAMGGGIVASDLDQIGEVLSPAIRANDLARADLTIGEERSVLCTPGDADEFADAVIGLVRRPDIAGVLGRNARRAVVDHYSWRRHVERLWTFAAAMSQDGNASNGPTGEVSCGPSCPDADRPTGGESAQAGEFRSLEWFLEAERYRYVTHAPWMPQVMEFALHPGRQILEIGAGIGIDLVQFARHGAIVTDVDRSERQLRIARRNLLLNGVTARFIQYDTESLPFADDVFDLVYAHDVIHWMPDTARAVAEILRVLKPGGRIIASVYAENSLQYWRNYVWRRGLKGGELASRSVLDIIAHSVEPTGHDVPALVKVYTRARLRKLFGACDGVSILQRHIATELVPHGFRRLTPIIERLAGWYLIVKATKHSRS